MANTWQRERARKRAAAQLSAQGPTIGQRRGSLRDGQRDSLRVGRRDNLSDDELEALTEDAGVRQSRDAIAALVAPELRFAIQAYIDGDDSALPESREIDLRGPAERRSAELRLNRAS